MKKSLLKSSLASSTRKSYKKHLNRFSVFMKVYFKRHVCPKGPVDSNVITQFIAYLGSLKYSASTIISNISAVYFIHKLNDWVDPGDYFVVKKMLTGAKKHTRFFGCTITNFLKDFGKAYFVCKFSCRFTLCSSCYAIYVFISLLCTSQALLRFAQKVAADLRVKQYFSCQTYVFTKQIIAPYYWSL